jgi:hypothetical protein
VAIEQAVGKWELELKPAEFVIGPSDRVNRAIKATTDLPANTGNLFQQVSGDDVLLSLVAKWPCAGGDRAEIGDRINAVVLLTPKVGSQGSMHQGSGNMASKGIVPWH